MIGIYLLKYQNSVVYVGQSVDVKRRIKEHKQEKKKKFDEFIYISCPDTNLNSVEAFNILKYSPKYNKERYEISVNIVKKKKSKGMQVKLTDDVYDKITKEAKKLGMPRTQFINMLVNEYLKQNKEN